MSEMSVEMELKQDSPKAVTVILRDALCFCCLNEARAIFHGTLLCRDCFEWMRGPDLKNGWVRTLSLRCDYLAIKKNGGDLSYFD